MKTKLWQTIGEWAQSSQTWVSVPYDEIDIDVVTKQMLSYRKTCQQCEYGLPDNEVVPKLKSEVNDFYLTIPLLTDLTNSSMSERHWLAVHDVIGFDIYPTETTTVEETMTLGQLMDRDIKKFANQLNDISSTATNERNLEIMLEKLVKVWRKLEFNVIPYKDKKNVYILGSVDDITTALDDSLVTISTLLGSRYIGPIKPQVEDSISVISPKNSKMNLSIDEISLNGVKKYDGITIKESGIRDKFGVSVVGIMSDDGESIMNPTSNEVLRTNQTIILIGEVEKMDRFKEELP